jgi:hypothetical protein
MVNEIYLDGGRKKARPVTTREAYIARRNTPENAKNFYDARAGNEKAKARQVQYNYGDLLPDGVLKGCCHPSSTFPHDIDCNDAEEQARIKDILIAKKDEIGLLELSGSARYGLHAVCRRERGRTILESQVKVALLTKTEMDTSAHDQQRVLYTGPATADNLFYLDDAIFDEPLTLEESAAEFERLKEREARGEEDVPAGAKKANKHYRPWEETTTEEVLTNTDLTDKTDKSTTTNRTNHTNSCAQGKDLLDSIDSCSEKTPRSFPNEYHGIPFATILKKYWEVNNGGYEPTEGDRDTLTFQLASDLRHICGKSFEWLDQVIPCYDGFPLEEKRQKIKNALASKYEGMPTRLKQVLDALTIDHSPFTIDHLAAQGEVEDECSMFNGQCSMKNPPEMPEKVPRLIALLTSKTPQMYRPAVAHAVFPALGTHLKEVRFLYTDNVEHEATLMNILMAGTGAGKGCIDKPIKHIMADIRRRDAENEKREREWKKDCQKKGANKDKLVRPEGLVIQIIDPDMTKPALVTRMDESEGHFVYVKLNELDLFDQLKGTTGKQHFQLMCLAFDPDSEYGQTRIGTQSVTARPRCRFNWNACTTVQKGQRYFRNVLTDGPISRINFCTIPESEIGIEQPVYGQYDAAFDEALKPYIDNLCAARGFVDCPQATRLAKKLQQECAEFARLSQDEVYWNLSFRACVIAWLKACVLYVANGCKWEKTIEDFVRWSLNYDLWCKMQFFGDAIRQANNGDERIGRRGPHNLLLDLPDVFSFEDARRVRRQQGLPDKGLRPMISNWKSRGYINQISEISFEKLRFKSGE